jgi:tRNA pseudouridine55 synthase
VDGLLCADKPSGPTSAQAVAEVKRRLAAALPAACSRSSVSNGGRGLKVGHAGTLDPLASGLLAVLVGEATKLEGQLHALDKVYLATVRFGAATDTYDAQGRVTREGDASTLDEGELARALGGFVGTIRQRPPAHSALKSGGRRLYERARAGEQVEVPEREVVVRAIRLLELRLPEARIEVVCGKGTYVRSIAHDLGERLGVPAHLAALRRTRIGPLSVEGAWDPFGAAEPPPLIAPAEAVAHLPARAIDAEVERRIRLGQQQALEALGAPPTAGQTVRLVDGRGALVAIAQGGEGRWRLERVFTLSH